ncbi:MAG: hypothetical protein NT159_09490 [Proteobacteria bacterium]|nr:hypothetical protein [Pseudomonadota bacterium]
MSAVPAAGGDACPRAKLIDIANEVINASGDTSASSTENARYVAFVRSTLEGVQATHLAPAKWAVTDLGPSGITVAGADLLASNAAQDDYTRAVALTAGRSLTSADSIDP